MGWFKFAFGKSAKEYVWGKTPKKYSKCPRCGRRAYIIDVARNEFRCNKCGLQYIKY
jgi:ribosomal protein S27E